MYTGMIEAVGTLGHITRKGAGAQVLVLTPPSFAASTRVKVGDSVAANGVCLTATAVQPDGFYADVSAETMALTCFKHYASGELVNLELPCTPTTHLGGHIVQGHVDGIGRVVSVTPLSEALDVWVDAPQMLMRYIAYKGSIAVDGMSLTVNGVETSRFRLTLIPHTQAVTNLCTFRAGREVNLEVDVLARYLERLLSLQQQPDTAQSQKADGLTLADLLT